MAAKKGHKKAGGRKKGTPNKRTQSVIDKVSALGCDPIVFLCHVMKGDWEKLGYQSQTVLKSAGMGQTFEEDVIQLGDRKDAAKELAHYIYPKRKAIEISTDENPFNNDEDIVVDLTWEDDESNPQTKKADPASEED